MDRKRLEQIIIDGGKGLPTVLPETVIEEILCAFNALEEKRDILAGLLGTRMGYTPDQVERHVEYVKKSRAAVKAEDMEYQAAPDAPQEKIGPVVFKGPSIDSIPGGTPCKIVPLIGPVEAVPGTAEPERVVVNVKFPSGTATPTEGETVQCAVCGIKFYTKLIITEDAAGGPVCDACRWEDEDDAP